MKGVSVATCLVLITGLAVAKPAGSLLTSASFPKTADDLTFSQRVDLLTEGYEPFETEFDSSGRCISNCPYVGFTISDQIAQNARNEQISQQLLDENDNQSDDDDGNGVYNPPNQDEPPQSPGPNHGIQSVRQCSVFLSDNKIGTQGPRGEPLANCPRITSKYGFRTHPVTGERSKMHNGVDLSATVGTNVYATGDGTVSKVVENERLDPCGKYIKITHPNGMISVYCHLSEILVKNGEKIQSGCLIAKSGKTGRVTGPHLHYSVRLSNNQGVDPEKWLPCKHSH
ncbi:MAG: M23 family metallopeptidase [Muribaculaceae bacterium]|nr:M23 family metallopeptidase [Muribaculaceae bacterium]